MPFVSLSRWGLLPCAIPLTAVAAARVGALVSPVAPPRRRALFGAVAILAGAIVAVRVLGALGALSTGPLFATLLVATIALVAIRRGRAWAIPRRGLVSHETAPVAAVSLVALAVAILAACWLPVWQWDSLGYHLPYVDFALQRGTLGDVPRDVPYLSTYPHAIELFFTAWRAMLPDDRLVDAAQIPLGLLGAGAVACLARELGARSDHALAAGMLWATLPAVFLQLPTNYIDVGCAALLLTAAAFTLAEPSAPGVVGAGLALGLFLGAKPNAPIGAALVFAALAWRAWRAGLRAPLAASLGLVLVLGGESYVTNLVRHGNPVWPVRIALGPFALPGTESVQKLLDAGAAAPRLHGPLPWRILRSWTAIDAPPMFDMRYGGLGLVFLAALPAAGAVAWRRRDPAIALVAVAAIASPDPSMARYVLAFPGLVLALGAVAVTRARPSARALALGAAAAAAAFGLVRAAPALTGEGPPLAAYASMSERERLRAVGANGRPTPFYDALERLEPGDSTVYDASFDLPYLAWPPDLSRTAARIPDDAGPPEAERIVADLHVRLLIVDRSSPVAAAARARPGAFAELFRCKSSPCVVFFRT